MRVSLMLPGHYIELIKLCINKTHLTTRYGLVDQHIGRKKQATCFNQPDCIALRSNEIPHRPFGFKRNWSWLAIRPVFFFRIHKEMHLNKRIETKKLKFENRKAFYK